jgi:uncharacterized protein
MTTATGRIPTVRSTSRPALVFVEDGEHRPNGGRCSACGLRLFPFTPSCPSCAKTTMEVCRLASTGEVYSRSTVHVGTAAPYTLAYVDLDDGVRLLAKVRGDASIGGRVRVIGAEGGAVVVEVLA